MKIFVQGRMDTFHAVVLYKACGPTVCLHCDLRGLDQSILLLKWLKKTGQEHVVNTSKMILLMWKISAVMALGKEDLCHPYWKCLNLMKAKMFFIVEEEQNKWNFNSDMMSVSFFCLFFLSPSSLVIIMVNLKRTWVHMWESKMSVSPDVCKLDVIDDNKFGCSATCTQLPNHFSAFISA